MHEIEQNAMADEQIDTVNINSFHFNRICSAIVAKLKVTVVKIVQLCNTILYRQ